MTLKSGNSNKLTEKQYSRCNSYASSLPRFIEINMDYQQVTKQLEASSQEIVRHLDIFSQQATKYLSNRSNVETVGKITAISVATYVVANVCPYAESCYKHMLTIYCRGYIRASLAHSVVCLALSGANSSHSLDLYSTDLAAQGKW